MKKKVGRLLLDLPIGYSVTHRRAGWYIHYVHSSSGTQEMIAFSIDLLNALTQAHAEIYKSMPARPVNSR